ncbi:MAG TPA: glycosyltransferase [Bacteroidia bacterium]|nr:glycosyltransferase [Bacteroidia bacterium]HRH07071.1 glycosyltransferase [Bacteroidia bacterium]
MLQPNSHIVVLCPGFAADESDVNCITYLQYFLLHLKKLAPDKKISIIAFEYPFINKCYEWNGITVHSMGGKSKKGLYKFITWLKVIYCFRKINKSSKVTAVMSFWLRECSFIGLLLSKQFSFKFFALMQGQDSLSGNWYLRFLKGKKIEFVSHSTFNAKIFQQSTGAPCQHVVPFGVDYENIYQEWPLENTKRSIDIIGIGSLLPVKNYTLFLELISELKSSFPALRVVILGEGPQRVLLQHKINLLGLKETVVLKGFVGIRAELFKLLNQSKIFLHTSKHEGQCYAFMEAYAYGLEVVSFDVGYLPNTNKSHRCNSKAEMLECLRSLLASELKFEVIPVRSMQETALELNALLD